MGCGVSVAGDKNQFLSYRKALLVSDDNKPFTQIKKV